MQPGFAAGDGAPPRRPRWLRRLAIGAAVLLVVILGGVAATRLLPSGDDNGGGSTASPTVSAAPAATAIPATFAGDWSGPGRLPSEDVNFTWRMTLVEGSLTTETGSSETACMSGTLTWVGGNADQIQLKFRPPPRCNSSHVTLTRKSDDTLHYRVVPDNGSGKPYEGELHRQ